MFKHYHPHRFQSDDLYLLLYVLSRLLKRFDFEAYKFSLYFMGYEDPKNIPQDEDERSAWVFRQKACIELTQ